MFTLCGCRPARGSGQRYLHCVDADIIGLADRDVKLCGYRHVWIRGQRCLHCVDADLLDIADRDVYTVWMPTY